MMTWHEIVDVYRCLNPFVHGVDGVGFCGKSGNSADALLFVSGQADLDDIFFGFLFGHEIYTFFLVLFHDAFQSWQ